MNVVSIVDCTVAVLEGWTLGAKKKILLFQSLTLSQFFTDTHPPPLYGYLTFS